MNLLLGVAQVFRVAQQKPARLLDHPARRFIVAQPIGLIQAHAVDDFPAVFRHHMEEVVHYPDLEAVLADFQVKGSVHVHAHRLDTGVALRSQLLEEGPDGLASASLANPEDASAFGVQHGIAMPLVRGRTRPSPTVWAPALKRGQPRLEGAPFEQAHSAPMQTKHFDRMADGQPAP